MWPTAITCGKSADKIGADVDIAMCSDIYSISVIFVILWFEIGAKSSFLVYQLYFHGMSQPQKSFTLTIIKAQEKIAQNTNNLSNIFYGQAQAEYYLVGPNIIFMALYSINSLFPPLESRLQRTRNLPHKQCFSDMVNKMNHIPTLSSTGKFPKLH